MAQHATHVEGAAARLVHDEQRVKHGLHGGPATHAGLVPEPGSGGMVGSAGPSGQVSHGLATHDQAIPAATAVEGGHGQVREETAVPVMSAEEKERQLAAEEMR